MEDILIINSKNMIGRRVTQYLSKASIPFKGGIADKNRSADLKENEFFIDCANEETYLDKVKKDQTILLFTPPDILNTNCLKTILRMLKKKEIKRIIYLSKIGAKYHPKSIFCIFEKEIKKSGLKYTLLRSGLFMQNFSTLHRNDILLRNQINIPAGNSKYNFVDADEVAMSIFDILKTPTFTKNKLNLIGNELYNMSEIAEMFSKVLKRKIIYNNVKIDQFVKITAAEGKSKKFTDEVLKIYKVAKLLMVPKRSLDLNRILGKYPKTFLDFIEENKRIWKKDQYKRRDKNEKA